MIRIPRPLGLTNLSTLARRTKDKDIKTKLIKQCIKGFILKQMFWPYITQTNLQPKQGTKNRSYKEVKDISIDILASFLGMSVQKCSGMITNQLVKDAKVLYGGGKNVEKELMDATRALSKMALILALDKGSRLSSWSTELQAVSRLKGYHAGTVMATNSAIGLELQNDKLLLETIRFMAPNNGKGTTINLNQNNAPHIENNQHLTPTMALGIIEEKSLNLLPHKGTLELETLKAQYRIDEGPNVQAIQADAQGAKKFDLQSLQFPEASTHQNRRELELNIEDGQVE